MRTNYVPVNSLLTRGTPSKLFETAATLQAPVFDFGVVSCPTAGNSRANQMVELELKLQPQHGSDRLQGNRCVAELMKPCLYWRSVASFPGPDSGSGVNSRGPIVRDALYGIALLISAVRYERIALSL